MSIHNTKCRISDFTLILLTSLIGIIEVYLILYWVWTMAMSTNPSIRYIGWSIITIVACASTLSGVEHTLAILKKKPKVSNAIEPERIVAKHGVVSFWDHQFDVKNEPRKLLRQTAMEDIKENGSEPHITGAAKTTKAVLYRTGAMRPVIGEMQRTYQTIYLIEKDTRFEGFTDYDTALERLNELSREGYTIEICD